MSKDFTKWTQFKEKLHLSEKPMLYKPGEIWWCALGINIGHEQDGDQSSFERPIVILKTFSNNTCLCAPMTTSSRENPFYYPITIFEKKVFIITSQLRTLSIKRLLRKTESLPDEEFKKLKDFIRNEVL